MNSKVFLLNSHEISFEENINVAPRLRKLPRDGSTGNEIFPQDTEGAAIAYFLLMLNKTKTRTHAFRTYLSSGPLNCPC